MLVFLSKQLWFSILAATQPAHRTIQQSNYQAKAELYSSQSGRSRFCRKARRLSLQQRQRLLWRKRISGGNPNWIKKGPSERLRQHDYSFPGLIFSEKPGW
jgi:hypothetical protein